VVVQAPEERHVYRNPTTSKFKLQRSGMFVGNGDRSHSPMAFIMELMRQLGIECDDLVRLVFF
jgi:hypothetical protein